MLYPNANFPLNNHRQNSFNKTPRAHKTRVVGKLKDLTNSPDHAKGFKVLGWKILPKREATVSVGYKMDYPAKNEVASTQFKN